LTPFCSRSESVDDLMLPKRSLGVADHGHPVPLGVAAASAFAAAFFALLACIAGTSALRDDFEGVRPMVALLATLLLGVTALMTSFMARGLTGRGVSSRVPSARRRVLWAVAIACLAVVAYVFLAAAPGSPAFHDSWAELIAAVLGLWIGLAALNLLDERLMWRVVGGAAVALVAAAVAIAVS
jgi:hypothetical protein